MKRLILLGLMLAASGLMAQPQTDTWDAGNVDRYDPTKGNGIHRADLQVVNRCCKGEHQFEVSSPTPWIVIHPSDAAFPLGDGEIRMVHPGLDTRTLASGIMHEGTISVRCTTCEPGKCSYDVKVRLAVGQQGTQVRQISSRPEDCPTPPFRVKPQSKARKCSFTGVYDPQPDVTIEPCIGYGEHATDELKTMLGDLGDAMSKFLSAKSVFGGVRALKHGSGTGLKSDKAGVGDAVTTGASAAGGAPGVDIDVPTTPGEIPAAMASNFLKMAQKVVDWGDRAGGRRGRMCLTVSAAVEIRGMDYDCVEWQVCEQGVWRDEGAGSSPRELPSPLPVIANPKRPPQDIFIIGGDLTQISQALGQIKTWANQLRLQELFNRMEAFEMLGPCQACNPQPGGGEGDPDTDGPGGRNCQRILWEISQAENMLFELRAELEDYHRQLQQAAQAVNQHPDLCRERLRPFQQAVEDARSGLRRAARAGGSISEQERALKEATEKLDEAQDELRRQDAQCQAELEELKQNEVRIQNSIKATQDAIDKYEAHLKELQAEYQRCLGQGS